MDTQHWIIYILFISIDLFFVSFFLEIYKKKIRKDNFKVWEVKILGLIFSVLSVWMMVVSHLMYPLFYVTFRSELWLDYAVYIALFYLVQEKVDMKIMKKLIKSLAIQWLRTSTGLDKERVEEILDEIDSKKKEN